MSTKKKSLLYQALVLVMFILAIIFIYTNITENLGRQKIASGFSFLSLESGFEISESLIDFDSSRNYGRALVSGVLNTLKVSLVGNLFALLIGVLIGIFSLSKNWLLKSFCRTFIESMRNVPLLLQLFFWYALFTEVFPSVRSAYSFLDLIFLSNRGLVIPGLVDTVALGWIFIVLFISIIGSSFFYKNETNFQKITGKRRPYFNKLLVLISLPTILTWFINGMPYQISYPLLKGFNFEGGYTFSPEFISLLLGLTLYTSAFIAEIVRAGILSVPKGQWEAGHSLGLKDIDVLRFVILPQSMRVIIPPLTSQFLNLTKNSSLAVAIAYPDFVSIANTTMNQTGQAIELVLLIMCLYLTLSLITSVFMNWYNQKMAIKER